MNIRCLMYWLVQNAANSWHSLVKVRPFLFGELSPAKNLSINIFWPPLQLSCWEFSQIMIRRLSLEFNSWRFMIFLLSGRFVCPTSWDFFSKIKADSRKMFNIKVVVCCFRFHLIPIAWKLVAWVFFFWVCENSHLLQPLSSCFVD